MAENTEGALSHRSLVAAAGAAACAGTAPALAAPDIPSPQGAGFYRFRLGDAAALVVSDGDASFPGWPLWSTNAPRETFEALQRERFLPSDQVRVHCNALLLDVGRERVLIEAGAGPSMGPGFGRLPANLRHAGVDPASITAVVVSHGHNDHFHGLVDATGGLAFPNARIVWAEEEWRYWNGDRALGDFRALPLPGPVHDAQAASVREVLPRVRERVDALPPGAEVAPGVRLVAAPGHTPAHVAVLIGSANAQLLYVGDVLHRTSSSFAHPDWSPAFDHLPDVAAATRRRLLEQAAADRALVMGYHWSFPALGHVRRENNGFGFEPVAWEW